MIYETKEFKINDLVVSIKTPDKSEAKEVLDFIIKVCGQSEFLLSSPEDFEYKIENEEKWIESNINSENYFMCVYVDGKIVGDCNLNFMGHLKDKHRSSVGIVLDKEYWNKGIGSLLFDEMIRLAKEKQGVEQIELGVVSTNQRAKHLYEKKGFVKTGVLPNAIKLADGSYRDEELMTKFLY